MSTKKKNARQPLKPVLFAITKSNLPIIQRPYGECLLVTDNHGYDIVEVQGSRFGKDYDGIMIIPRSSVLFYTNTDLRSAITEANNMAARAYKELYANTEALMNAFQKVHEVKE